MQKKRTLLPVIFLVLMFTSCHVVDPGSVDQGPADPWKTFSQLKTDLKTMTDAGYSKVCLFDLHSIRDYPDPRYISLLKKYADAGLEITVYVQQVEPNQDTLDLVQSIGASSVILYEKDLLALFKEAGIKTFWWSGVAYPPNHIDRLQYMGWPDLRSEEVRQDIATWAVQIPEDVDGGLALDYIRWNKVGDGRTAEQVTDLVQRIRTNWNVVGNGTLSAAVYPYVGKSPSHGGASSVGQRWNEWLENDLLDFVYPMAYNSEDIPWHIEEWESYDKHKIIPCLSVAKYN